MKKILLMRTQYFLLIFPTYCTAWLATATVLYFSFLEFISEKAMAPHSSTLAWKIPWTEEPGRLQSMGSLGARHDWATSLSLFTFMHWRRKWQPHSSILAWRIPGTGEPGGLPSLGLQRVRHDQSDLAAAAAFLFYTQSNWNHTGYGYLVVRLVLFFLLSGWEN